MIGQGQVLYAFNVNVYSCVYVSIIHLQEHLDFTKYFELFLLVDLDNSLQETKNYDLHIGLSAWSI
jgi:hypothetical protein